MPTFDEIRKSVESGGMNFNKKEVVTKPIENNDWWNKFINDRNNKQVIIDTLTYKSVVNDMSALPAITKIAEDIEKYIKKISNPITSDLKLQFKNSIKKLDSTKQKTKTVFQKFSDTTAQYLERAGELIEETVKFMESSFNFGKKVKLGGAKLLRMLGDALVPGEVYSNLSKVYSSISKNIEKFISGTMRTIFSLFSNTETTQKIMAGLEWVISKTFTVFSWIAKTGFYLLDKAWSIIKGLAKIGWNVIKGVFTTIYDLTLSIGDFFVDLMIEIFSNPIILLAGLAAIKYFSLGSIVKPMLKKAGEFISVVWDSMFKVIKEKYNSSTESFLKYIGFGEKERGEFITSITSIFDKVFNMKSMTEWWNSSFGKLFGLPSDSFASMIKGISSFSVDIWHSITGVFGKLVSTDFKTRIVELWDIVKSFVAAFNPQSSPEQEAFRNTALNNFDSVLSTQLQPYASTYVTKELIKHIYDVYGTTPTVSGDILKPELMKVAKTSLNGFVSSLGVSSEFKEKIQQTLMNEVGISIDSLVDSVLTTKDLSQLNTDTNIKYLDLNDKVSYELAFIYKQLKDYSSGEKGEDGAAKLNAFLERSSASPQSVRITEDFKEQIKRLQVSVKETPEIYRGFFSKLAATVESSLEKTELGLVKNESIIADFKDLTESFTGKKLNSQLFNTAISNVKNIGVSQKDIDALILMHNKHIADIQSSTTGTTTPKLATGGIVKDATLTWVGEGKSEEMVIPINKSGIQFIYDVTKNIFNESKKKTVKTIKNYYESYSDTGPDETLYDLRNIATGFVEVT